MSLLCFVIFIPATSTIYRQLDSDISLEKGPLLLFLFFNCFFKNHFICFLYLPEVGYDNQFSLYKMTSKTVTKNTIIPLSTNGTGRNIEMQLLAKRISFIVFFFCPAIPKISQTLKKKSACCIFKQAFSNLALNFELHILVDGTKSLSKCK